MALMESQLMLASSGVNENMHAAYKSMEIVFDGFEHMYSVSSKSIDVDLFRSASRESVYLGTQIEDTGNKAEEAANQTASAADIIKDKFSQALSAVKSSLSMGEILELADSMSQTRTRLAAVTGDLDSAAVLQDKILDSATRAGVPYQEMADAVANMGIQAKNAFGSNDEIVAFTELINKQFAISGTSAEGMSMSMDKLTQTMASGVLSGEDFNSIMAQAPAIVQTIADYMGMPVDKIQELAAGGQLTADIIRNAMFSSADEINTRFSEIPYTFGQVANMVKNVLLKAFDPLLQIIGSAAGWIYDNWSVIEPVLAGIAITVGILTAAWAINTAVTWLQVAANQALIVSMLSNPLLWIALLIGVVVAAIYKWIQSVGGLQNAWEICKLSLLVGWSAIKLAFFNGVYKIIDLLDKLKLAWKTLGTVVPNFMGDMKVRTLMILQSMVNSAIDIINSFIGLLNKIPGVSINTIEHMTFATTASAENEAAKRARNEELAAYEREIAEEKANRDAKLEAMKTDVRNSVNALNAAIEQGKADAAAKSDANYMAMQELGADTGNITENTGSTAASLNSASEDLEYLRDIAEQEAINKFTTSEVKIDMSGMTNRIDSDMDIDGIITKLTDGFAEALEVAAEGVHI